MLRLAVLKVDVQYCIPPVERFTQNMFGIRLNVEIYGCHGCLGVSFLGKVAGCIVAAVDASVRRIIYLV